MNIKGQTHVLHLVISLAPGGLERLVVDWTNARNQLFPGRTVIGCLDKYGELASQVADNAVVCVKAKRDRFPWDQSAVRRIVEIARNAGRGAPGSGILPAVIHAHNLAAWQYAVLAKVCWRLRGADKENRVNMDEQDRQDGQGDAVHSTLSCPSCVSMSNPPLGFSSSRLRVRQSSLRLVYTQHGANVHNMRLADRIRARILACFTDEIVAVSEATAEVMARTLWIPRRRIKVVVNGVAERKNPAPFAKATAAKESRIQHSEFSPLRQGYGGQGIQNSEFGIQPPSPRLRRPRNTEVRRQMGIPAAAFVIGSVGRLVPVKGYDRLIAAFAGLCRSQTTDCRIRTAGQGEGPHPNGAKLSKVPEEPTPGPSEEGIWEEPTPGPFRLRGYTSGRQAKEGNESQPTPGPFRLRGYTSARQAQEGSCCWLRCHWIPSSGGVPAGRGGCDREGLNLAPFGPHHKEHKEYRANGQDGDKAGTSDDMQQSSCKSCLSMLNASSPLPAAFLLLVGDGPERANLERQARELGVGDRVVFAGFQADPEPYYSVMDLFVLSSRSEGLSISLLEAMAKGVPVAVTDVGANREVIADGRCGLLLPDDDSGWAAILASLYQKPAELLAKVQAARERVCEHYSLDATLRDYEALYGVL